VLIRRIRLGGERRPVPTPEDAIKELRDLGAGADPLTWDASEWPRYIVGAPAQVKSKLEGMARDLQVDELMVLTVIHDHRARLRSYELLADSFGLTKRSERNAIGVATRQAI
jgi:alkanesulfonate monooxygenase SsuD/methylene tetrahydromethanopterin reductase-like flavin-dependent oxidoreductase (luciferase family)